MFGVATSAQIDIDKTRLVERDNPMSRFVLIYLSLYEFFYFLLILDVLTSWSRLFKLAEPEH